jgi:hypothetical protein
MEVSLIGSTEKITDPHVARRWVQNHARVCYSEKNWGELLDEEFQEGLVKSLIQRGHHSPFDHFVLNFNFKGLGKALAMVFNNQGFYTTSEKSARYTRMADVPDYQAELYDEWGSWFLGEISRRFPENKFPKLYFRKKESDKSTTEKLAQENARYMTSVFTPTNMTHTLTWRQMNILYHQFNDFIGERNFHGERGAFFKSRLAGAMTSFVNSPEIEKWVIDEAQVRMKGGIPLRFFRDGPVEEHFGEDIYSFNGVGSFAMLAQSHRHRLDQHQVYGGFDLGGKLNGFYIPRLVGDSGKEDEWIKDLERVAVNDFPQGQLLNLSHRGRREDVIAKTEERECGLAQLEIARYQDSFLRRYAEVVPAMRDLAKPACEIGDGCHKGGCTFGAAKYLERLI